MATTVAIDDNTLNLLKHMKEETESQTYDETIRKLIGRAKKPKRSYLG